MSTEVNGTLGQYKDFLSSIIWKDLSEYLLEMREDINNKWVNCEDNDEILRYQGRAQAIDLMIRMPETILDGLMESRDSERGK